MSPASRRAAFLPLPLGLPLLLLVLGLGSPVPCSGGRLRDGSGHRRKDHEERVPVAASHHLVQEMAAFSVRTRGAS